jgi:hypothetical protein
MQEPFVEHKGIRFGVGLRFIVALTRRAGELAQKEMTIEDVLKEYIFDTISIEKDEEDEEGASEGRVRITPQVIDRWQETLGLSYAMAGNEQSFDVVAFAEEHTFTAVVEVVGKMAVACVQTYTGKPVEGAAEVKKKAQR